MTEYERAVELDPDYAMAWVGIAEAAGLLMAYSTLSPVQANERNARQRENLAHIREEARL